MDIGQVEFMNHRVFLAGLVEMEESLEESPHDFVEVIAMIYCESATRHSDQFIACADIEPGIARHNIHSLVIAQIELFGRVLEAIIERGAVGTRNQFLCVCILESRRVAFKCRGREDNRFPFLDGEFEISRDP